MTNFSNTSVSSVDYDLLNKITTSSNNHSVDQEFIVFHVILCVSIVGLVGNGTVIYLLGFQIKRSPFTTYILNLAVADFGVLLFGILFDYIAPRYDTVFIISFESLASMYSASQLLLAAISMDRCVAVLFPIWHRCHRPPRLSTVVCTLIWVLSSLPSVCLAILLHFEHPVDVKYFYPLIAGAVLCSPLVIVSTIVLLFRVFCKSKQHRRGRILTIVLLTLFFFLIFGFPLNAIVTVNIFIVPLPSCLPIFGFLCATLNSCVNPVIYFMVGRKKRAQQRQSLKVILQRAFQEEERTERGRGHHGPEVTVTLAE